MKRETGEVCVCEDCPYNQFKSGKNGGKACQNRRRIYILREGELFPMLLSLPTGSLPVFRDYMTYLINKGRKSNSVVTRFALQKVKNKGGIEYTQAKLTVDRPLTPEERAHIQRLTEQISKLNAQVGFEEDAPVDDAVPLDDIPALGDDDIPPLT